MSSAILRDILVVNYNSDLCGGFRLLITYRRIRNWREYNDSLVKRGSITLWISAEGIEAWKPSGPKKRGGQPRYTDGAIQFILMLRSVFRLPLRGTEGFVRSIFEWMESYPCRITLRNIEINDGAKLFQDAHLYEKSGTYEVQVTITDEIPRPNPDTNTLMIFVE